jgi:tetratricopeptide (TPR) repeat protein
MIMLTIGRLRSLKAVLMVAALLLLSISCARQAREPSEDEKVYLHLVAAEESLEQIAEDYYGDPGRADDLREYNDLGDGQPVPGSYIHVPLDGEERRYLKQREAARVPYNEGLELVNRGAYVDAVRKFQAALDLDPGLVDARYNLGVTYQKMKAYDKAIVHYRAVYNVRKRNPKYSFAIGYCQFHLQRHKEAIRWFERVLEIQPDHARAQYSLAVTYDKLGQSYQAADAWRRYLEIDADSDWADEARRRLENLNQ